MSTPEHSPLGKSTVYADRYDPRLLFPIPRADKRAEIGVAEPLPFHGVDIWNAYELSWLDPRGKPVVAMAEFRVPAASPEHHRVEVVQALSQRLRAGTHRQTPTRSPPR